MTNVVETSVLIVGAGPVGLTLSMVLARRGVDVTILEQRARGEPPPVKSNHVSARSMEIFRRLGIADTIRDTLLSLFRRPGPVALATVAARFVGALIRHVCCRGLVAHCASAS